jgi:hypothetical protein
MRLTARQMILAEHEFELYNRDLSQAISMTIPLAGQLAGFEVLLKEPGDTGFHVI